MNFVRKTNRLPLDAYSGAYAYSLTLCTADRRPWFVDPTVVRPCIAQLSQAPTASFDVHAYCFMPDHLHLLVAARTAASDLVTFLKQYKQTTGFWFKKTHRAGLWQKSYFDHALRRDEDIRTVARYIFNNPVRAGLVTDYRDYPFLGSFVYDIRTVDI